MTVSTNNSSKSTVALHMIVKDEAKEVVHLLNDVTAFDEVHLTVSNKTAKNKLSRILAYDDKFHVYYRAWNDRFDEARQSNWEKSNTTYAFWVDADDYFNFKQITRLVQIMDEQRLDAIYLPYNYAQDEYGNCIAKHWRERLIRRSKGFEWRGWVHESLICDTPFKSQRIEVEVEHRSDHLKESTDRNHKILLEAAKTGDPRYLHYLGLSYFARKEFNKCIKTLHEYIKVGGWDEEIYRSFINMSEAAYQLDDMGQATEYALKAMAMLPAYPQSYWLLAQYENDQDNPKEAFEWAKVAESKALPDTMSIVDPTCVERNRLVAAQALFTLGKHVEAYKWLKMSKDPLAIDLQEDFRDMAETETFMRILPTIRKYFKSDKLLWQSLDDELQYDNRLRGLRESAVIPQIWSDKSIVFLCGKGYEEWGPHTLDKGMGGSEEAIIYLSRELVKLGWEVTVYGEVERPYFDFVHDVIDKEMLSVIYRPWKQFDPRDTFNVFVGWRSPVFMQGIDAKVKICDIHDVLPKNAVTNQDDVTYFVKSKYHRELFDLSDEKFHIIGNGILKEQFNA